MKRSNLYGAAGVVCAAGAMVFVSILIMTSRGLLLVPIVLSAIAGYSFLAVAEKRVREEDQRTIERNLDTIHEKCPETEEVLLALRAARHESLDDATLEIMATELARRPPAPSKPREPPPPPRPCHRCGEPATHRLMYREEKNKFPRYGSDKNSPNHKFQWDSPLCDFHYRGILEIEDVVVLSDEPIPGPEGGG